MHSFGGLLDDLLSYCTYRLLYRFPNSKIICFCHVLFCFFDTSRWLTQITLALDKVSFNSLPISILPHVAYYFFMFLENTQKMSLCSYLTRLFNLSPRSYSCVWLSCCLPQLWAAQPMSVPCENRNPLPVPPLKNMVAQSKANGHGFDELSTNVFCIYMYGQVRLTCLPKKK